MTASIHQKYMSLALELAQQGRLTVSPNPMVGCVIVKDNQIAGQGYHQRAGEPHAEIYALRDAGAAAQDATIYVTLEPCCHYGRTPPCTQQLIDAGVKQVVVACLDPNPLMAGKGVAALRAAGITVDVGVCEAEAKKLNEIFFHYITTKRPFVIAKWAMSLDGKTITNAQDSRDISSAESRMSALQLREQVDAVLVGSGTAVNDNPLLTVRHHQVNSVTRHPVRIVLASRGDLPLDLKMFDSTLPAKTIIAVTNAAKKEWLAACAEKNIKVITVKNTDAGQVDLQHLLTELGKREITSMLVEGGMTVHESFFREKLVNRVSVYVAPIIIGDLTQKQKMTNIQCKNIETDMHFIADFEGIEHV